jgi:rare lipoprotein A
MTANGETFNPDALTAASKTIAFDTRVRVTSVDTGRSVIVRINDRGPYIAGRCLDLSRAAFDTIDDLGKGAVTVKYEILR